MFFLLKYVIVCTIIMYFLEKILIILHYVIHLKKYNHQFYIYDLPNLTILFLYALHVSYNSNRLGYISCKISRFKLFISNKITLSNVIL